MPLESSERPRDHKGIVRVEFTRQAPQYAANPTISNPDRVARLVSAIQPSPNARVRAILERDAAEDLSGTQPVYRDERYFFTHRIATVVGRRLAE